MINCDECLEGINAALDQLASEEFVTGIVEWLSGDGFCDMEEESERCANAIMDLMPLAIQSLYAAAQGDSTTGPMICNNAIPDTCPAQF